MRKLSMNLLKLIERESKSLGLKKKRYAIGTNPENIWIRLYIYKNLLIVSGWLCNTFMHLL